MSFEKSGKDTSAWKDGLQVPVTIPQEFFKQ